MKRQNPLPDGRRLSLSHLMGEGTGEGVSLVLRSLSHDLLFNLLGEE